MFEKDVYFKVKITWTKMLSWCEIEGHNKYKHETWKPKAADLCHFVFSLFRNEMTIILIISFSCFRRKEMKIIVILRRSWRKNDEEKMKIFILSPRNTKETKWHKSATILYGVKDLVTRNFINTRFAYKKFDLHLLLLVHLFYSVNACEFGFIYVYFVSPEEGTDCLDTMLYSMLLRYKISQSLRRMIEKSFIITSGMIVLNNWSLFSSQRRITNFKCPSFWLHGLCREVRI